MLVRYRLLGVRGKKLGRPLGYFVFSLIGFKRTMFRNVFQRV